MVDNEMDTLAEQMEEILRIHHDDNMSISWSVRTVVGNSFSSKRSHLASLMMYNVEHKHIKKWIEMCKEELSFRLLKDGDVIISGDQAYTWTDPDCTELGWLELKNVHQEPYTELMVPIRRLKGSCNA